MPSRAKHATASRLKHCNRAVTTPKEQSVDYSKSADSDYIVCILISTIH